MSDIAFTSSAVIPNATAKLETVKLGDTLAAGDVVYEDSVVGGLSVVKKARANALATAKPKGILVSGGSSNQLGLLMTKGILSGATVGDATVLALSFGTAGKMCPVTDLEAGESVVYQRIFGTGLPNNQMVLDFGNMISGEIAAVEET